MTAETKRGRFMWALRCALHPAFLPAAERRFQALIAEAENARGSRDLAKAERLYLEAMADAGVTSDAGDLIRTRIGLGHVYQERRNYRQAEKIFRELLDDAVNSSTPNTEVHAGHMSLARLYEDEGKTAEAEEHYKAALAETAKPELWNAPWPPFWCSTAMWLAKFYAEQHRYGEAESLYRRVLELYEEDPAQKSNVAHHVEEFAKFYEAQGNYESAEALYRRALGIRKLSKGSDDAFALRTLENLARICRKQARYDKAETLCRIGLAIAEEKARSRAVRSRGWRFHLSRRTLGATASYYEWPVGTALERLAEICEDQKKYAEAEPLRRRSLEIKERTLVAQSNALGKRLNKVKLTELQERRSAFLADSHAAHANDLREIGREQEAAAIDDRIQSLRAKYPPGSMRCFVRATSARFEPGLRGIQRRLRVFVTVLFQPSQSGPR